MEPKDECEHGLCTYFAFMLFGSGSAWIVVSALYMELAIYQESFGLTTSNRMAIGYDLGALCVPVFLLVKAIMSRYGCPINYKLCITMIAILNLIALLIASHGVSTISALILLNFLGGSCGYLSATIHQAYVVKYYRNVYSAAFNAGDSAASVYASVLGILQRPELDADQGRNFEPCIYYLTMVPIVVLAYFAFLGIDHLSLGALSTSEENMGFSALRQESLAGDTSLEDQASLARPSEEKNIDEGVRSISFSRPNLVVALSVLGFCISVTCWGIGDSIIPFACAQTSCLDDGKECVFQTSIATNCALLIGPCFASFPARPTLQMLYAPILAYIVAFIMLWEAVDRGGKWATPWESPLIAEQSAELCGGFVVLLVAVLRSLGAFICAIRIRLIQLEFFPEEWESVNSLFAIVTVVANFAGVFGMTFFLPEKSRRLGFV